MSEKKTQNVFWPDVKTIEGARRATRYGVGAALFVAAVTGALATWALVARETVIGFVDAKAYVDAVLFAGLAYGIYKESRVAAVAGLAIFLLEKAYQVYVTGQFQGALVAILLMLAFATAVRGAFALKRLRSQPGGEQNSAAMPS